jgi:Amt family ammonium transporter
MRLRPFRLVPVLAAVMLLLVPALAAAQDVTDQDIAINTLLVFFAAVLVLFMQAGFAMLEVGLSRMKNAGAVMGKILINLSVSLVMFWAVGFAIAFGTGNDFLGHEGWLLDSSAYDFGSLTLPTYFIFQVAFAATAATIVSGAMAERTKFKAYLVYSFFITALVYPIVVHWLWGGGWLAQLDTPMIDFAGSTIVHSVGGWAALMGVITVGARLGKYGPDGKPRAIPGHSLPFAIVGVFILFVGWFGFNPGSELAADLAVGSIAVTTLIAGAAGAVSAMITVWLKTGRPDVAMTGNGVLAGLVGITAGCASVDNWGAGAIGAIAGVIVVFAVFAFDRVGVDDPVGAISVHGVCGAWGTLAVGLFATEGGLFYGDGVDQLVSQAIGVAAVFAFVVVTTGVLFQMIKRTIGLRVPPEEEMEGLDITEHGAPGYNPDVLAGAGSLVGASRAPGA